MTQHESNLERIERDIAAAQRLEKRITMTTDQLIVLARVVKDTLWARLPASEAPKLAKGVLELVPQLIAGEAHQRAEAALRECEIAAHKREIVRLDGELATTRQKLADAMEHIGALTAKEIANG